MDGSFIGRERELAVLREAADGPASAFLPVYGRRRVGKSELLLHFLREYGGVYFVGQRTPAHLQLAGFLAAAAEALRAPLLAGYATNSWREALLRVTEQRPPEGRLVIVLDEFQWMVEASPELPSVLQELWDRRWRDDRRTMLVLCGSFVGFMEREVLGRRSPLFGRRTGQIHLQPFPFREARRFHPRYSLAESALVYGLCGGVPWYLRAFDQDRSVEANVPPVLLSEYAPLFREPEFLLREELRDVPNYYAVLMALARGSVTTGEVAASTAIPERSVPYYLNQLVELRYVRRRHPLTGDPPNPRQVRFVLDDPLLRFWFRFVLPNRSAVVRHGGSRAYSDLIRRELPAFFGVAFEALCREALPLIHADEGLLANVEVGEYWDRATQIDVVALRDDGWTDLGECRWGAVGSRRALADELRAKAGRFPNRRGATIELVAFTRVAAPPGRPEGIRWVDLEEIYGERSGR